MSAVLQQDSAGFSKSNTRPRCGKMKSTFNKYTTVQRHNKSAVGSYFPMRTGKKKRELCSRIFAGFVVVCCEEHNDLELHE